MLFHHNFLFANPFICSAFRIFVNPIPSNFPPPINSFNSPSYPFHLIFPSFIQLANLVSIHTHRFLSFFICSPLLHFILFTAVIVVAQPHSSPWLAVRCPFANSINNFLFPIRLSPSSFFSALKRNKIWSLARGTEGIYIYNYIYIIIY